MKTETRKKQKRLEDFSYPLRSITNGYTFVTKYGNEVDLTFSKVGFSLGDMIYYPEANVDIYEFQFERRKFISKQSDLKVSLTILKGAMEFLNKNRVLFFTSDSPTKKDLELFKLYDRWYEKFVDKEYVIKLNRIICLGDTKIYFSCYIRNDFIYSKSKVAQLFDLLLLEIYPNSNLIQYEN